MRGAVRRAKEAIKRYKDWYDGSTEGWSQNHDNTPGKVQVWILEGLYDEYKRLRESMCETCHKREKDNDALITLAEADLGD